MRGEGRRKTARGERAMKKFAGCGDSLTCSVHMVDIADASGDGGRGFEFGREV